MYGKEKEHHRRTIRGTHRGYQFQLAGVYKTAKERGFHKVYGMLHGIEAFWMRCIWICPRRFTPIWILNC